MSNGPTQEPAEDINSSAGAVVNHSVSDVGVATLELPGDRAPEEIALPSSDDGLELVSDEITVHQEEVPVEASATHYPPEPDYSVVRLIEKADRSAGKLVNLLAEHFPCFRDESRFEGRKVRLLKRAQIFVADLWAALNEKGYGELHDIDELTMFAGKHALSDP